MTAGKGRCLCLLGKGRLDKIRSRASRGVRTLGANLECTKQGSTPRGSTRETGRLEFSKQVRYLITETGFGLVVRGCCTPHALQSGKRRSLSYVFLLVQSPAAPVGANLT